MKQKVKTEQTKLELSTIAFEAACEDVKTMKEALGEAKTNLDYLREAVAVANKKLKTAGRSLSRARQDASEV